jgi:hypothetical protein
MKNGRITLFLSDKGGVGKTTFTANYVDYLRGEGQEPSCFEIEVTKGAIHRYLDGVQHLAFNESEIHAQGDSLDPLLEAALEGKEVIVDTGANTARGIAEWMHQVDFFRMTQEHGVGITFAVLVNGGDTEASAYLEKLKALTKDTQVKWVVIHALMHGADFQSVTSAEKSLEADIIEFEDVPLRLMNVLKEGETFNSAVEKITRVVEKQRFRAFARRFAQALGNSPLNASLR